jgi:hypothetical protein
VHHLPACRLAFLDDRCDFGIADIEHVVEQERCALLWRETLEQCEEGDGEIVGKVEMAIRRGFGHDRRRQPLTDVRLTLGLEPPEPID